MSILFKTEAELKPFVAVTAGFRLTQLDPYLVRALDDYLRPALGAVQLDALTTSFEADTLDAAGQALLKAVRRPLASLAAAFYAPGGSVLLGSTGPQQLEGANIKPANPREVATFATSFEEAGQAGLEALLDFLEDNRAKYPLWVQSSACTVLAGQLLTSAREFSHYVYLGTRAEFVRLQPALRDVEHLGVRPLTGAPLLRELHTQLAAGTVTDLNAELLTYIRPALANLVFKQDDDRLATGTAYLEELRSFLYDRADDYPLFKASPAYQPDVAQQLQQDPEWAFYGGF